MERLEKNDFVEIEFTGFSNGKIFDTTNKIDAEKIGINIKNIKPLIISIGNGMIIQGIDEDLQGKEIEKNYSILIPSEKAFGKRNSSMVKTYGLGNFKKQNINPYPGMTLQLDNIIVKVLSVNGGRVTIDFNNPLAGKEVNYNYKAIRIINDINEKINALQDFFFRQRFSFEIKEKKVIFKESQIAPFLSILGPKFKEITDLEFTIEENIEKKEKK